MPNYRMVPIGQVISTFANMEDGEAHFNAAYPGFFEEGGFDRHVKTDPTSGAWMVKVPDSVESEINRQNFMDAAKTKNVTDQGQNPGTVASAAQTTAQQVNANRKMSKQDMKASISQAGPISVEQRGEGKTANMGLTVGEPTVQQQPKMSVGPVTIQQQPKQVTPFLASVLPTPKKKEGM